jgi:TPR repeat protein
MRTTMKAVCVATALALAVALAVRAEPLEDGTAAYRRGDYAVALKLWRPLAELGNPEAQFNVGRLYAEGRGVPENAAEATRWYRLAAEQGQVRAQHALGLLYATGEDVPKDYVEAYAWWTVAAANGRQESRMLRDALKLRMTRAELAEAKEHAQALQRRLGR